MKWIIYLLTLLLSLGTPAAETLSGTVAACVPGEYILLETDESGIVQVNFDSQTINADALEIGDTVTVTYDGIMTRSIPAQIYAERIDVEP